jgi:hypothetical protein
VVKLDWYHNRSIFLAWNTPLVFIPENLFKSQGGVSERPGPVIQSRLCVDERLGNDHDQRPLSDANNSVFDKLVADIHYDIHEISEIKEAMEDYYG